MIEFNFLSETELTDMYQSNLPLTTWTSRSWLKSTPPYMHDDILAEARVGLWKACKTFDTSKGCKFATYAVPVIRNTIGMYMRRQNRHTSEVSMDAGLNDFDGLVVADLIGYEPNFESGIEAKRILKELNKYKYLKMMVAGKNQSEMAKLLGFSQSYVSRLLRKERKMLREEAAY